MVRTDTNDNRWIKIKKYLLRIRLNYPWIRRFNNVVSLIKYVKKYNNWLHEI